MDDSTSNLEFLNDRVEFKKFLDGLDEMDSIEKLVIAEKLENKLTSSSWVTNRLFKPGIRNLFILEKIQPHGMYKKLVNFLGDQYYHFKFFFQNKASQGNIPTVMELLKQAVNMPRFRFRMEALDMLVELKGYASLPDVYNLLSGISRDDKDLDVIAEAIESNLGYLVENLGRGEKYYDFFKKIRFKLLEIESSRPQK